METEHKYKSILVVWNGEENPVIETFYAGTEEELQTAQEEWMNAGGYKRANMHLYIKTGEEWRSVQQCVFAMAPKIPEFALLSCSPHEDADTQKQMTFTVIQLSTGRMVRIVPLGYDDNEGFVNCQLTYENDNDKKMIYSLAVIRLAEEDMYAVEENDMDGLRASLKEELFNPLAHWYKDYLCASRKK